MFPLECFVSGCILLFVEESSFRLRFFFDFLRRWDFLRRQPCPDRFGFFSLFICSFPCFSGGRYPPVIHPVSMSIHATPCSRVKKYIPDNRNGYSAGNTAKTISSSTSTRLVNSVGRIIVFFPSARNNIPTDKNKAVPGAVLQWHKLPEAASVPLPVHKKDCFLPYQP